MEMTELKGWVDEAIQTAEAGTLNPEDITGILSLVSTVLGEQIQANEQRQATDEAASNARLAKAAQSLSYSEIKAMTAIFKALDGTTGLIVTSKVADEIGLARSVIVAALKKLAGAGVLTSQSLGMKGTYIKVLNQAFLDELKVVA